MITLRGKLKKDGEVSNSNKPRQYNKRASIRDKLLVKEVIIYDMLISKFNIV